MNDIKTELDKMGLSATFEFVPFSQSRNKQEKHNSLNYIVTVLRNEKPFLTTEYSMRTGHISPLTLPKAIGSGTRKYLMTVYKSLAAETGKIPKLVFGDRFFEGKTKILPKIEDVIYSLQMDSEVLHYVDFSEWAGNFGYDEDSRSAEKIYHACLDIALKMRIALGEENLKKLAKLYEDY